MSNTDAENEPMFTAISNSDKEFQGAYRLASETIDDFIKMLQKDEKSIYSVKLRFRDPDLSEKLGEDRFLYIWLTNVYYHEDKNILSGEFFELPQEMQKWHKVGQRLGFDKEDVFDWMIIDSNGQLRGGYTLRVSRSKLPENERVEFDKHVGVSVYM